MPTSSRTSRALNGILMSFLQVGLALVLQAALSPLVLHIAGQETLGAYAILLQVIGYLALVDFGFGVALSRYLAQASGYEDNKKQFLIIFTTGRTFYAISNLVFALLILIFSFLIGSIFSFSTIVESQARTGLWILAGWSILRIPFAVYGPALTATQNMAANNIINMGSAVVRIMMGLGMLFLGFGLVGLMLGNVMAEAFNYIFQRWYYSRLYPEEKISWGIPNMKLFKEMLAFSGSYLLVIIGGRLSLNTDNLVVGALFGGAATSIYYTTQIPTIFLVALIWKIVDNSAPAINELYGKGNAERLKSVYLRLYRYNLLCAMGLAFGLIAFNRETITLWVGSQQYAGDLMNISLVIFVIATVISHLNAIIMVAFGTVHFLSVVCISGGVLNLILSVIFGKAIGLQGVMLASAIAESITMVILQVKTLQLFKISFLSVFYQAIKPALAGSIFSAIIVVFVFIFRSEALWISMFFWMSIFIMAWIAGTVTLGLDKEGIDRITDYIISVKYVKKLLRN